MQIKQITIIILLMNFGILKSQNSNSINSTGNVSIPNFTPPSPKSFEYTKYGDVPVNEFTGVINTNIPLYEYKVGNLSQPISLDYVSSGVKVDQSCSWTGINWVLRNGGVITRTINDLADDLNATQYNRVVFNSIPFDSGLDGTSQANSFVDIIESYSRQYDSEADLFNFNFNGYTGSFFLDNDFVPTIIKNNSELKISIVNNLFYSQAFIITTPNGVKYYFGGENAIETESGTSTNPCSSCGRATAYYLTKIEDPINGIILFEYETTELINVIARSRNFGFMTSTTQTNTECGGPPPPPDNKYEYIITTHQNDGRFLKRIYSPDSPLSLEFLSENKNLGNSSKILKKINVKNGTETIKEIEFNYYGTDQGTSSRKRFFLTKLSIDKNIAISNNLSNKFEEYNMEYDNPQDLPDRLSFAQDYYGYYNGKLSNTSSIPKLNFNSVHPDYIFYNSFASDRKPNFQFAKKGTLKKLIYPTKGYTEFEYEAVPVKEKVFTRIWGTASQSATGVDLSNSEVPRSNGDFPINLNPIIEDQDVDIKLTFSNPYSLNMRTQLIIKNLNDNTTTTLTQTNAFTVSEIIIPHFHFQAGVSYNIRVVFLNPFSQSTTSDLSVTYAFDLLTGYRVVDGKEIRIKKVINKSSPTDQATIKRYYYVPVQKVNTYLNPENVAFESLPRLITYGMKNYVAQNNVANDSQRLDGIKVCVFNWWDDQAYYTYINSNAVQNSFTASNETVYEFVTISYGGDNFENGGTQKVYKIYTSDPPQQINSRTISRFPTNIAANDFLNKKNNENVVSGDLIEEIDFEKKGGRFFKKRQKDFYYAETNINKSFVNIVGKKVYDIVFFTNGINDPSRCSSNYYIVSYLTKSFNTKLNSTSETNYFSNCEVPDYPFNFYALESASTINLSDYPDPLNVKKITTTQTFEYGTLKGLPTKITTDTSTGDINSTVNTYVNQSNTLTGLSTAQSAAYNNLFASNRVAAPIEVAQFRNSDLLSKQRTVFKEFSNNHVLPETIQTALGVNPLEVRAIFEEYDDNGNPTLVHLKDGSKTKYIYNSNNQVVAKIENFTGNAINIPAEPCQIITNLPNSLVTLYTYDNVTQLLTQVTDSNCRKTTYVYDELHRLKQIIDHDGNILKEFDNNYRPN